MDIHTCVKESFSVIGKEGSTEDGQGFIQLLWRDVQTQFKQIDPCVKREPNGRLCGIWGVMSDFSRAFLPWENNFSSGLYLAGAEVHDDAQAPQGWVKWTIPGYEYIYVRNNSKNKFAEVRQYLAENNMELAGAAHDFNCQKTGQDFIYVPVKRL
ncbi:Bacterial transcription activator, effector binding domain [Vibrio aerogenes CECT 7868]|uniref:Bacterial transcription activator, effector binding domain n=1 Tax=Vibrio aerogenes CECT 7868 TaxID=1216006 RepID=A0A1M6DBJ6_9VIBR|nr:GyrI-like domain-containing protein [Vibrio aerogenes]SHI70606.1 Bacterial transcription activator, effector binding domain [Vibrio aerogenes CECT 7868]